jgi:hypothetical protein
MKVSSVQVEACSNAWLHCENLLISLFQKDLSFSLRTRQVLEECANICLGTLQALRTGHRSLHQLALLCVGICEECAEMCERYNEIKFQTCAAICRRCSAVFTPIAYNAI